MINGEQVIAGSDLASHLDIVQPTDGSASLDQDYTYTVKSKDDDDITGDGSVTASNLQTGGRHDITYIESDGKKDVMNASKFVYDLDTVDLDSNRGQEIFDEDYVDYDGEEAAAVEYVNLDTGDPVTDGSQFTKAGHYMAIVQIKKTAGNPVGGKGFIKWTNVHKKTANDVSVRFGGILVTAGKQGRATYTGSNLDPEVTVEDLSSDDYTVEYWKTTASGKRLERVDHIVDAGYYQVIVTPKDGQNLSTKARVTTLIVDPIEVVAQVSDEGQTKNGSSEYFVYTGNAVSPKLDFFKRDDSGDYAEIKVGTYDASGNYIADANDTDGIEAVSDLTEAQKALLGASGVYRYSKVDVPESAYVVTYKQGSKKLDASALVDKGTYTYSVRDAKPDKQDNYAVSTSTYNTFQISAVRKYDDVALDAWYAERVNEVTEHKFMTGYAGTKLFGPEDQITRGQVACVLYNMAKSDPVNPLYSATQDDFSYSDDSGYATGYSDVNGKMYYAQAIAWAEKAGVVHGYGDGTFRPDQSVTTEEFAAMLSNYASKLSNYQAGSQSDLDAKADGSAVSDWAKTSVAWALHNGIIGNNGANIDPQGNITRGRVAGMVMNLYDIVK